MDSRSGLVALCLFAFVLAGCVDESVPEAGGQAAGDTADPESGADAGDAESMDAELVPVEPTATPFELEGRTPASVGVCGFPEPADPCVSHVVDEGDYVLEVPHAGNVSAMSFVMHFDAVTPFVTELFHMVHVDDGVTNTMVSGGPLADGEEVTLDGLVVNATASITFFAWPVGGETPIGPYWLDPLAQPFTVEGTLHERIGNA